ncbi:MAG: FtsX-like permease family protein [candidate division WOR-3 bacterium]|nr:M28 family peptidase [Candidatus Omnitrophota bacterium]
MKNKFIFSIFLTLFYISSFSQNSITYIKYFSSFKSRFPGSKGHREVCNFIETKFKEIGLKNVKKEKFFTVVPVEKFAYVEYEGKRIEINCFWPNLVRTSTLPPEGIEGKLIYAGKGNLKEVEGKEIFGSIIVMDFDSGSNWINFAMLGAKCFIFVKKGEITRTEGEKKFLSVPVDVPRFYCENEEIIEIAKKEVPVKIYAKMDWEKVEDFNIYGFLEGRDKNLKDELIIISAYYDSISVVPSISPGATSACGIGILLELAEYFVKNPPKRSIIFLATSSHFMGMKGIDDFIQRHSRNEKPFSERIKKEDKILPTLFIGLDISDKSNQIGIWHNSYEFYHQRFFAPLGKKFMEYAEKASKTLGFSQVPFVNGISPEKGLVWTTFLPEKIRTDGEYMVNAGNPAISLITVNDGRWKVDTPDDKFENLNLSNILKQAEFLKRILSYALNDESLFEKSELKIKDRMATLKARIVTFNPKKSFVPNEPVKNAIVVPRIYRVYTTLGFQKTYIGVRGHFYELTDENGIAEFSRFILGQPDGIYLNAFYLDPESGEITLAPDYGVNGNQQYPINFPLDVKEKERMIVLFKCKEISLFGLIDPQYLIQISNINVFDISNSLPDTYGYFLEYPGPMIATPWSSSCEHVGCVFAKEKTRIKIIGETGPLGKRLLLLNSKETYTNKDWAEGLGFEVDEISAIYFTPYQGAKDMIILDEYRRYNFEKFGIKNERLIELQDQSKKLLKEAERALKEKKWYDFLKFSRQSQSIEARAYPDVKNTANDVVKGVIFYFIILLPFAYFCERLIFSFAKIEKRIAGVFGIFLVIYWIMRNVHPAFKLTNAPEVILLSFIVLVLSGVVISIVAGKFEEQMQRLKRESAKVYQTDVGRITATGTAFSLGVANMKRRKIRTALTTTTLILLTFTVLSFTSIKSYLKFNQILRPNKPVYTGLLLRDRNWYPLQEISYEYTENEFSETGLISPRSWIILSELGNRSAIEVKHEENSILATGILGLTPYEIEILPLKETIIYGRWFEKEDEDSVLISDKMAKELKINYEDVGKANVNIYGKELKVIGIFDSKKLNEIKDLDDEKITPVDFSTLPEKEISQIKMEKSAQIFTAQIQLRSFTHTEAENTVIMPFKKVMDMKGTLQSIAVKFTNIPPEKTPKKLVEDFITKLAGIVFAGFDNKTFVYSSIGFTSFGGISNILIPILIASLIVLNTMLGSVYERIREIGTYSAVGLAPVHIASLFFAESLVYAILGAVGGYLLGQVILKILLATGLLKGLVLNYSSLSAVISTIIIVITVLLSTLYPARKASQMAVPDVTRKWILPPPKGDFWEFEFPFTVSEIEVLGLATFLTEYFNTYQDVSLGNFYTNGAVLKYEKLETEKNKYIVETTIWLAPFDLGVSQEFKMIFEPLGQYNFYTINLYMKRISGESTDWKRLNRRFLDGIRKQFLIWRTVSFEIKKEYEAQGKNILKLE